MLPRVRNKPTISSRDAPKALATATAITAKIKECQAILSTEKLVYYQADARARRDVLKAEARA
jgi:hypothetical protein